jgi:hypothetical protein
LLGFIDPRASPSSSYIPALKVLALLVVAAARELSSWRYLHVAKNACTNDDNPSAVGKEVTSSFMSTYLFVAFFDLDPVARAYIDTLEVIHSDDILVWNNQTVGGKDLSGSCKSSKVWDFVNQRGTNDQALTLATRRIS